jgi:hypothetical protein
MNNKIIAIADRILQNAAAVRFGQVSATMRIHDGRIVDVTHTVTESTKQGGKNETYINF